MINLSLSRLAVAVGGLALSLTVCAGVASADPDLGPAINTTCTYPQFVAALHAATSDNGAAFDASPENQAIARQFLAAPPSRRAVMAQMLLNQPGAEQEIPVLQHIFSSCNNY
jgi:hemophore-related protein